MIDLDTLIPSAPGWQALEPVFIADDGTIIGTGSFDGELTGFELTPISVRELPRPSLRSASPFPPCSPAAAGAPLLDRKFLRSFRRRYAPLGDSL